MTSTLRLLGESRYAFANPYQDVRGWAVQDSEGVHLGHLDDVLIDEAAGKVRFLKVVHGGLLGFGSHHSFIPIEAVTDLADGVITIDTSAKTVAGAPLFDPEVVDNQQHIAELYSHYGYPPPWVPSASVGPRDTRGRS